MIGSQTADSNLLEIFYLNLRLQLYSYHTLGTMYDNNWDYNHLYNEQKEKCSYIYYLRWYTLTGIDCKIIYIMFRFDFIKYIVRKVFITFYLRYDCSLIVFKKWLTKHKDIFN